MFLTIGGCVRVRYSSCAWSKVDIAYLKLPHSWQTHGYSLDSPKLCNLQTSIAQAKTSGNGSATSQTYHAKHGFRTHWTGLRRPLISQTRFCTQTSDLEIIRVCFHVDVRKGSTLGACLRLIRVFYCQSQEICCPKRKTFIDLE